MCSCHISGKIASHLFLIAVDCARLKGAVFALNCLLPVALFNRRNPAIFEIVASNATANAMKYFPPRFHFWYLKG